MKKLFTLAVSIVMTMAVMGQNPVITFNKTTHDFGKINEADGRVTTTFTFKNEGMVPLVLTNVRASCGCTTPKWTREPIEPGQSGEITVTYNPSGRPGRFQKTVTVTSNSAEPTTRLYIKGEVIAKPAQPADQYPIKMGNLSLKKRTLNFGAITQGSNKMLEIEYANQTTEPVAVELLLRSEDSYIKPNVTLKTVGPNETGKLQFALQTGECPLLGPINVKAYVMVDGKRNFDKAHEITLTANIREDFSHMSVEELQQAPIVEVAREINLGTLAKGERVGSKITIANAGYNPLHIRRVVINDSNIKYVVPKSAIKGGRKADLKMELTTSREQNSANYTRLLTLITNDPKKPVITIKLNWVIE